MSAPHGRGEDDQEDESPEGEVSLLRRGVLDPGLTPDTSYFDVTRLEVRPEHLEQLGTEGEVWSHPRLLLDRRE